MKTAKHPVKSKANHFQLWLFLLSFTTAFFPLLVKGQQPFTCEFSNPDGGLVYPCASVVKATINFPPANNPIQQIQLIFPNSFEITSVDGLPFTPSTVAIPGGYYNGPYSNTDLLGQWITVPLYASQMIVTLAYRSCDIYPPINAATLNTNNLFFDCKGSSGSPFNINYNAVLSSGNPGLPIIGSAAIANNGITNAPQAIEVIETPTGITPYFLSDNNNTHSAYNDEIFLRYFDVIVNSTSIEAFNLIITDEVDVDELELLYVSNGALTLLAPALENSTGNTTNVGFGNYSLTFISSTVPFDNFIPAGAITTNANGSRKITLAQEVQKNCDDIGWSNVSTNFNCGLQCPSQISPTPPQEFLLDATAQTLITGIDPPNISLTSEPGSGNSICGPTFAYTFDFNYSDNIISRLNNFILPINTQSFEVQSVEIGDGNNFTLFNIGSAGIILNQPSATSTLDIDINALFGNITSPPNPCFTNILPFSNPPIYGAWINTNPAITHLVIRINLQLIPLTSSNNCPDIPLNLGMPFPNNNCTLLLSHTCGGNIPRFFNIDVTTPPLTGAQIIANFPQSVDLGVSSTLPVSYVIQIPEQSPFEIMVNNVPQISCSTTVYQAVLSMGNGESFGNSAIPTATIIANGGTPTTIIPTLNTAGSYVFNLPYTPPSQGFYTYSLSFQLGSINCPLCSTCSPASTYGAYVYNLQVSAICQGCTPEIRRNIICAQNALNVHCIGTCDSPVGFNHNGTFPDIERITLGWIDEYDFTNNPNTPLTVSGLNNLSALAGLTPSHIEEQLNSVYPFDLFTYKASGSAKPEIGFTITTLGLQLIYPQTTLGGNFLQLINYEAVFTETNNSTSSFIVNDNNYPIQLTSSIAVPAQTTQPITIAVPSFTQDMQWDVGSAANPVGLFPLGIDINNVSYEITVTATFRMFATTPAGSYGLSINGQFIGESNDGAGTIHHLTSCDPWHTDLKVIIPSVQVIQNSAFTGNINLPANGPIVGQVNTPNTTSCKFGHAIGIRHSGGNGSQPDFYPEYRPLTSWPQQIDATNIASGTGFFPGAYTYSISLGSLTNGTNPLLPPLQRQLPPTNLQGLVLTLTEDCPNSGNLILPSDLEINRYAYINDQHLINTPPPPNPPTNPAIAAATNPPAGNTTCNFLTLPGGPGIINLSNATPSHIYDFNLQIPASAINLPFAIRITPPLNPNVLIPINNTNVNIPGSTQIGNWFVFSTGLPNTNLVQCSIGIQIVGNNGCYALPFDVNFEVQVYCNDGDLPTLANQNPISCLTCNITQPFQRGAMDLSNVNITTNFLPSPSGCDFVFQLNLTNPIDQPIIHAAGLILEFSTGMILQNVNLSFSQGGSITNNNFPFYLNQNNPGITTNGIFSITANSLTLNPGETLIYTLTFQLAEAWCNGLYDPATALFGLSLLALNGCEPVVNIPISVNQTALSSYISTITQDATCCVPNPGVTVTNVCDANATNGIIEVNYPNFGPGVQVTLFRPELCAQIPCSWTTTMLINPFIIDATNSPFGLGVGTYRLVVWDSNTGAFFEQFVVIENHSFTATINSNLNTISCGNTNIVLNAIPNPAISISGTGYTYLWSTSATQNSITVAPAATTTYNVDISNGTCIINASLQVDVLATPLEPVILGTTTICQTTPASLSTTLTIQNTYLNESYNWFDDLSLTNLVGTGGIFTTLNLTSTTTYYVVAINNTSACTSVTSVTVNVVLPAISANGPTTFCSGSSVTLTGNISTGVLYNWWKDGVYIPGADFITFIATESGFYQLYVTDQVSGCSVVSEGIMVEVDPPIFISGSNTACSSGLNQYSLPSYFPANDVLGWYINGQPIPDPNNTSNYNSAGLLSIDFDWAQNNYFGGTINVETNIICGSSGNVTFSITPCCSQIADVTENNLLDFPQSVSPTPWNNGTITYDVSNNLYTIEGATFELNNTGNIGTLAQSLNCNANLTLIDCNIAMASGNQFLINATQDVVVSNTYIKACEYRHRGIRAENGGNDISIAGGQIEDADYGVRITNGILNCKIAGFNKNLYHIFAIQSDVKINGGYYTCTGNIVPVNNVSSTTETTYWAIDLYKCMTPSNTLPSIYNILINNAGHGIRSIYGGIDCKGNTINNTVQGIIVSHGYPYSNNTAQNCFIGDGGGTNIPNEFNNSYSAINVFGKLSNLTIKDNRINNCKTYGMHLAKLEGNGFTVKNNKLNNCRIGIHGYLNLTNGTFLGSSTVKEIVGNEIYNHPTNPILHGNYLIQSKGIFIEEQFAVAKYPNIHIDIIGNEVRDYRHGISLTNCVYPLIQDNSVYVNSKLDGIWDSNGSLTNFINGIGIFNCPGATIVENKVSSTETTPFAWATWLTSGFRVDMSPKSTICGNLASETGNYPGTSLPMQIGDPFEFHGNCFPTRFKLNTMDQSTSRALYMGGLPIGNSGVNGTIIGVQGSQSESRDNYWNNILSGFHTDYNNVDGALNMFWMSNVPTWPSSSNNFQAIVNGTPSISPQYSFQSDYSPYPTIPCSSSNPSPLVNAMIMDAYDDIARDSISKLGGNDTTRYFGKEFLYSQVKSDNSLTTSSVLMQFKDAMDLTNVSLVSNFKEIMQNPLDSATVDSLNDIATAISPDNNIEENYKNVFELATKNPELKDSIYNLADYLRLRTIAKMCPYVEGTAVYTARVILHAFEPDSNYYNYCEFAKRPDRESSERNSNMQENNTKENLSFINLDYKVIPNPNNGEFSILCPDNSNINLKIYDNKGAKIFDQAARPNQNVITINLNNLSPGIYNLVIINAITIKNIKFAITK